MKLPVSLQKRHLRRLGERLCAASDVDPVVAVEALDVVDPTLTYEENKRLYLEELRGRGVMVPREEEAVSSWERQMLEEEARKVEELKEVVREEMEKKVEVTVEEPMTKEEFYIYLRQHLAPETMVFYRDEIELFWTGVEGLTRSEILPLLDRAIEKLKKRETIVRKMTAPIEYKPPEGWEDFVEKWMRRFGKLFGKL